jgi:predicted metal-dependent HD superfamily phosphohydrolase
MTGPDDTALLAGWRAAVRSAGAATDTAGIDAAGVALLGRWHEAHRRYHDAEHLREVLAAVDVLSAHADDPAVVRLAAWFHDAVYAGRPGDDEAASAAVAEEVLDRLGVPAGAVARVAGLVRMTARHEPADGDADAAVLSDADLAILGAPAERYARYTAAVRAEYAHVPDEAFRAGRAAVLAGLAQAPRLFRTRTARARWEDVARANLAAEIAELTAGG